jgi:hypothetical protein
MPLSGTGLFPSGCWPRFLLPSTCSRNIHRNGMPATEYGRIVYGVSAKCPWVALALSAYGCFFCIDSGNFAMNVPRSSTQGGCCERSKHRDINNAAW